MNNKPRLKITDIRIVQMRTAEEVGEIEPAWDPGGRMRFAIGGRPYVEVHTDEGLVGIGPAVDSQLLPAVKEHLVGKGPFDQLRRLHI